MVHIKYTPVAGGTVMASFRLEDIAHEAVPSSFILTISQVKAPENRDLAGVCKHGLEERPNK